jgi:hypothetical protein
MRSSGEVTVVGPVAPWVTQRERAVRSWAWELAQTLHQDEVERYLEKGLGAAEVLWLTPADTPQPLVAVASAWHHDLYTMRETAPADIVIIPSPLREIPWDLLVEVTCRVSPGYAYYSLTRSFQSLGMDEHAPQGWEGVTLSLLIFSDLPWSKMTVDILVVDATGERITQRVQPDHLHPAIQGWVAECELWAWTAVNEVVASRRVGGMQ